MRSPSKTRDEWLALRCQTGVPAAFDDLIAEMERPLFYYLTKTAGSEDKARDILQEVWLRAFRGLRKLHEPSAVRAWLYTLAHAAAVDQFRHQRIRERAEDVHLETVDPGIDFQHDDALAIHQALDRIEPNFREVLVLFFLEDFSLNDIARILDCPPGTVKSRLFYAKKALKSALSGEPI